MAITGSRRGPGKAPRAAGAKPPAPPVVSAEPDLPPSMKIETNSRMVPHKPSFAERFAGAMKAPREAAKVFRPTEQPTKVKRARLRVTRVDPVSVLRTSFLFAMAVGIVMFTVVAVVWAVLVVSGALESIQKILDSVVGSGDGGGSFQLSTFLETWRVLGFTALISMINVILLTLLGTVTAYLYNLAASIYGGIEITLAEDSKQPTPSAAAPKPKA